MDALHAIGRQSVAPPQQLLHDELLFARVRTCKNGRWHFGKVIRHDAAHELVRLYHVIYSDGSEESLTKQQVLAIAEPRDHTRDASQLTFREKRSLFSSTSASPSTDAYAPRMSFAPAAEAPSSAPRVSFAQSPDVGIPALPIAAAPSASASCMPSAPCTGPAVSRPRIAVWGLHGQHGMIVALILGVFVGLSAFSSPTPWPSPAPEVPSALQPEQLDPVNLWQAMWQEVLDTKLQQLEEPPKEQPPREEPQHELNRLDSGPGYQVREWQEEPLHEQASKRLSTVDDEPAWPWPMEEDWDAHFKMAPELEGGNCIELLETVWQEHPSMLLVSLGVLCFAAAAVLSAAQWAWGARQFEVEVQSDAESDWLGSPPPSGHREAPPPPESPQQQMPSSPGIERGGGGAQTPLLDVNFAEPSLVDSASPRSQGTPVGGLLAPPLNEASEVFADLGSTAPPANEDGAVFGEVAAQSPPPCDSDMMVDSTAPAEQQLPDVMVGKCYAFQDGAGKQKIVKVKKRLSDTVLQGHVHKVARRTLKTDTSRDVLEAVKVSDKEQKVNVSTLLPIEGFALSFGTHIPPATQQQLRDTGPASPPMDEAGAPAGTTPRRNEKRHEARSVPARTSMRFKWPSSLKQLRDMGVPDCEDVRNWLAAFEGDVPRTLTKYMEVHKQLDLTQ